MAMDKQAELLHWLMEQTSLTQVELGQRLGISASLVSRLVSGERRLTLSMLRQIAATFGLSQTEVFARAGALEEPVTYEQESLRQDVRSAVEDDVEKLRTQLSALRDLRTALAWSLEDRASPQTIEKMARLVELELEYNKSIKEG
jgi:transcriptional regulator with XRE-family HTH domain